MPGNLFLSYAREDKQVAERLYRAFKRAGCSVWWDSMIPIGIMWRAAITQALASASCVVVLWSKKSVGSRFVVDEAQRGAERNVLVQVSIDAERAPIGFGEDQIAQLGDWNGSISASAFKGVLKRVKSIVESSDAPSQELEQLPQVILRVENQASKWISKEELKRAIDALNIQLTRDFQPHWHYNVRLVLGKPRVSHGDIVITASKDKNWLSYHFSKRGRPSARVNVGTIRALGEEWSACMSHEVMEMIVARDMNLVVLGPSPEGRGMLAYNYEICDPVAADSYKIKGIPVSNFVLPSYFRADAQGNHTDFLGLSKKGTPLAPFETRPGGYLTYIDPGTGRPGTNYSESPARRRLPSPSMT